MRKISSILITGVTGSFGKKLIKSLLKIHTVDRIIAFSRDELKQFVLQHSEYNDERITWVIGDVRDKESLIRASRGVDLIIHAAALKQVVACEHNPYEAIKTNVLGAMNLINAALTNKVKKVISLSTDKAVSPVNLYGATKLCAEKLMTSADYGLEDAPTIFSSVRWGNVIGSRGSVIPFFLQSKNSGEIKITDERMTRFWITLEQAVDFVQIVIDIMEGGEVFVPKVPSMKVIDVGKTIAPDAKIKIIGIRPGEKLHEVLITADESRHCLEFKNGFIIHSEIKSPSDYKKLNVKKVVTGWEYRSDKNDSWLTDTDLQQLLNKTDIESY